MRTTRSRTTTLAAATTAWAWCCVSLGGCGVDHAVKEALSPNHGVLANANHLDPADFERRPEDDAKRDRIKIEPPKPATPTVAATEGKAGTRTPTEKPAKPAGSDTGTTTGSPGGAARAIRQEDVLVDAMVGQVTGRPIYASDVFKRIGVDELQRLGETQPRLIFKQRVADLIMSNLRGEIDNALVLAEAEAGLNPQQALFISQYLREERKKILADYAGSEAEAEKALQRKFGHGIQDELEYRRRKLLVEKFLAEKLYPKISVSRKEVEKYYNDHQDEINPPPSVALRVIVVETESSATKVETALAAGEVFEDVAKKHSTVKASQGGAFDAFKLTAPQSEFAMLVWPELNEKVRTMSEGERTQRVSIQHAGKPAFAWVFVEKIEGEEHESLGDVQVDIERGLRAQKFNKLSRQYIDDLWRQGNFTPVDEMTIGLIDVAMARFARPQ